MNKKFYLSERHHKTLLDLAKKLECKSKRGAKPGQPSINAMLIELAEGQLTLTRHDG